jgi:hypothetical protein
MSAARRYSRFSLVLVFAALLTGVWCSAAIGQSRDALKFDVPMLPDAARYIDLLAAPGVVALMLENNDLYPSLSSRLVVKDRESLSIRAGVVRFTGRKAGVFFYEAGFNISLGVGESNLTFPAEIDVSAIGKGKLELRLYPPLAKFVPEEILQKVEFKIRSLADLRSQRKLIDYLDRLSNEQQAKGRGLDGVLEAITLEAYNRADKALPVFVAPATAMSDSLIDGAILLGVLAIWLIGFPVFVIFARRTRKPSP